MSEEDAKLFSSLSLSSLIKRLEEEEEGVMRLKPVSASASRQTQIRAGFTFFEDPVNHYPVNQGTCNSPTVTGTDGPFGQQTRNSRPNTGGIA